MTFLIVSIVILFALIFLAPRRLSRIEILTSTLFGLYFESTVNIFLDLDYDLYGYFHKGVDAITMVVLLGVYPALNYLLLNFYPEGRGAPRVFAYLLAWDAFSVAYELLSIHYGIFYYNGWHWWYSALVYVPLFLSLRWQILFTRRMLRLDRG
ncbi:hypothetical protein I8J29_10120 [Paenibacillus sp. MWE-103]|uniref:Uncharacterized protein n=1 Tax=Paenibacillus artemisiicola TaxID=1172618 RepID=A0ABS3W8E6_9BACL|nr:CBO0543 family protein [Paenibacillus artemisiicola]MBO7744553.1 hypothetical protein [Paenibacillus artemisiicola]